MANINETINEISKINPELAKQVQKYVKSHSYGLVYEQNLPDAVRLWTKAPAKDDNVNILPPRGEEETTENSKIWTVKDIVSDKASLLNGAETMEVSVDDIVPVAGYKSVIYPGMKVIDKIERGNPDDPYHMVINAENYHALEALCYAYAGKVDCIYIDPPYNTGAKDWKYNNDYVDGADQYRHSKWLTFMERRLKLAKKLLNPEDSALIVTIDEKEYLRLGMLLEQLFPEAKIQMISSIIKPEGTNRKNEFSRTNEFIYMVFLGDIQMCSSGFDMMGSNQATDEKTERDLIWKDLRRRGKDAARLNRPNQFYPIFIDNNTGLITKVGEPLSAGISRDSISAPTGISVVWPLSPDGTETMWGKHPDILRKMVTQGYVYADSLTENKNNWKIRYLTTGSVDDIETGRAKIEKEHGIHGEVIAHYQDTTVKAVFPKTVWNMRSHNAQTSGTLILKSVLGDSRFSYPKSLYAVHDAIRFFVANKPNALILDFFAGSGTTLHATALLNAEDGGHRRCICVTNNEVSADEAKEFTKKGLRHGDAEWESHGIAQYVTWPRTVCSIKGTDINGEPLKGNYIGSDIPMADGFKANAVFCELTYESLWGIRLDRAFNAIAPILWTLAGCKGPIIEKAGKGYSTTDNYAVLFNYSAVSKFVEAVKNKPSIQHVFVVTDDQKRYSNVVKRLTTIQPENIHRLYESYLKSFEIVGEGGLD